MYFAELEEINLAWLGLKSLIPSDLIKCEKLKFINLSNNELFGTLPQGDWSPLIRLEIIEV